MLTEGRGMDIGQANPADVHYTYAKQVIKVYANIVFRNLKQQVTIVYRAL